MNKIISVSLLRDIPLALAYYAVSIAAMWISDYPVEDWIPTSIVGYVSLWLSRLLIVNLVVFALRRLRDHGSRVVERFGTDAEVGGRLGSSAKTLASVALGAVVAVMLVGLALTVAALVIPLLGLAPLASGFILSGLVALGVGATAILAFFGFSLILFAGTAAQLNKLDARVSQIEQSERVVSSLLPANVAKPKALSDLRANRMEA